MISPKILVRVDVEFMRDICMKGYTRLPKAEGLREDSEKINQYAQRYVK